MADARDEETNTSIDSVRTVDSEGHAPKRRMATPSAAWGAYTQARNANIKRDARFADIAGIFAGFPPTPPNVQERNGMADMPNLNTKQFQAKVNAYVSNWMGVTAKGQGWGEVEAEHDDPMEAERRSKYLTECFNWAIKKWDATGFCNGSQYIFESAARDTQMGLFGIGIAFFYDTLDWRWKIIPTRRVLVPEGTRLCLDNCPAIFIEDEMSVTELYRRRDKKGWNRDAILRNLYDRVEVMSQTAQRRWTYAQWVNSIRDNDQWLTSDFQPIKMVHAYTMEFDGTISHSIFTDQYNLAKRPTETKNANASDPKYAEAGGFIYDKTKVAERWSQVWIPFADNAGPEGDYHGVKGYGDLIFDQCHENNLTWNRASMGVILNTTPMFRTTNENDAQKLDQVVLTPMGLLYPGLDFEQVQFKGDPESALGLFNAGTQIIDTNSRIPTQNDKTAGGDQPTATQVSFDRADQAQFTTLQIDFYRAVGLDILFSEMYRRLAQPASKYPDSWSGGDVAKEFRKKCAEHGIPEADLLKVKTVRANRNGGSGNMGVDLMKGKELLGVATPGKGQLNARREIVASLKGWENVPVYIEDTPQPVPEDVQIDNENLLIQGGKTPQAFGFQDQERHLLSHMGLATGLADVIAQFDEAGVGPQNLEDAMKVQTALDAVVQHSAQHVQLMAEVRRVGKQPALYEQLVKESTKSLNNLHQISEAFGEKIAQAAQQQQQSQPSPEMAEAQQRMQIRAAEAEQELKHRDDAHNLKMGNLAVTSQARTEAKRNEHQLTLEERAQSAQQQAVADTSKTVQELVQSAAEHRQSLEQQEREANVKIESEKKKAKPKTKK